MRNQATRSKALPSTLSLIVSSPSTSAVSTASSRSPGDIVATRSLRPGSVGIVGALGPAAGQSMAPVTQPPTRQSSMSERGSPVSVLPIACCAASAHARPTT